jgi:[lysine-biosynthesis-protein LysW]---L-2-aminoadipate ligase
MSIFAVMAHRAGPTNTRLGRVLTPAQCIARLGYGDVVLGRLDVRQSLDGIEAGLWALDRLAQSGVRVLNDPDSLATAHDKLATARALHAAGVPHPATVHVAPWQELPRLRTPVVLKPRFGSWGRDVVLCETEPEIDETLADFSTHGWFRATGAVAQELIPPHGYDIRIVVAGGRVAGAIRRVAAPGEWRTNVVLGGRREPVHPTVEACAIAIAAAKATGGALVGVDLLPAAGGGWVVAEVNGAVDFTAAYSLGRDVFDVVRDALTAPAREPVAAAV